MLSSACLQYSGMFYRRVTVGTWRHSMNDRQPGGWKSPATIAPVGTAPLLTRSQRVPGAGPADRGGPDEVVEQKRPPRPRSTNTLRCAPARRPDMLVKEHHMLRTEDPGSEPCRHNQGPGPHSAPKPMASFRCSSTALPQAPTGARRRHLTPSANRRPSDAHTIAARASGRGGAGQAESAVRRASAAP